MNNDNPKKKNAWHWFLKKTGIRKRTAGGKELIYSDLVLRSAVSAGDLTHSSQEQTIYAELGGKNRREKPKQYDKKKASSMSNILDAPAEVEYATVNKGAKGSKAATDLVYSTTQFPTYKSQEAVYENVGAMRRVNNHERTTYAEVRHHDYTPRATTEEEIYVTSVPSPAPRNFPSPRSQANQSMEEIYVTSVPSPTPQDVRPKVQPKPRQQYTR